MARTNTASNPVGHPARWGFADGILGNPCECPWKGWQHIGKIIAYNQAYLKGQTTATEKGIKPLCAK